MHIAYLVNDAKSQGITQIALEATQAGRHLYEKYGFVQMKDEMELGRLSGNIEN